MEQHKKWILKCSLYIYNSIINQFKQSKDKQIFFILGRKNYDHFNGKLCAGLGISQIIIGVLVMAFNIVLYVYPYTYLFFFSHGTWGGIFVSIPLPQFYKCISHPGACRQRVFLWYGWLCISILVGSQDCPLYTCMVAWNLE